MAVETTADNAVQVIVKRYNGNPDQSDVFSVMKRGIEIATSLKECDLVRFVAFERGTSSRPKLITVMEKLNGDVRIVQKMWKARLFDVERPNPVHLALVQKFARFLADVDDCLGENAFTDMKLENVGFCGAPGRDDFQYRMIDIDSINAPMGTYLISDDPAVSAKDNATYAFGCTLAAFCMGENWDDNGYFVMPDARNKVVQWFKKIKADLELHGIDDFGIFDRAASTIVRHVAGLDE